MYYAFYARKPRRPRLSCAASRPRAYCVIDYVDGKSMGAVQGPNADLPVRFAKHLLLEATPKDPADCLPALRGAGGHRCQRMPEPSRQRPCSWRRGRNQSTRPFLRSSLAATNPQGNEGPSP